MKNNIRRVAAIHDLSGFSRVSLTAVIPILSNMGIQACPLPTAVLSTHTQYPNPVFVDLTDQMTAFIEHWKKLEVEFDAIYSGYLGSHKQVDTVIDFINSFQQEDQIIVVDPVLGDNGSLYQSLDKNMIEEMKKLICYANIITPNLTEASYLLNKPYKENLSIQELKEYLFALADSGPDTVVITSVPEDVGNNKTSVLAYNKKSGKIWKVSCNYLPANYPGTGDSFTSVLLGSLLQGDSLPIALDRAVQFISYGVRATFGYEHDPREGIMLEKVLHSLDLPVQMSSYEIVD